MPANALAKKMGAEAVGTFALVFAGCGALMVSQRFPASAVPGAVPLVFGLVIAVMVYSLGHLSGGHFNPAVTLGFAAIGKHPPKDVPPYLFAQFVGAVTAMALLAAILPPGAGFGATVPHGVSDLQALVWEALQTFLLMLVVVAVATDTRSHRAFAGVAIGAVVCLDAFVGGPLTGASMNPVRSLAPAIWEGRLSCFWIYLLGPIAGALAAAFTYECLR